MRHTASTGFDPAHKTNSGTMLLAFSAPALCAILGLIFSMALGYSPF
jgi:hypothetical protein